MEEFYFWSRVIDKYAKIRLDRSRCGTITAMQDLNDMVSSPKWPSGAASRPPAGRWASPSRASRAASPTWKPRLGVQLLQRSTRRLSLTPAGELYLRHFVAMRDAAAGGRRSGGPGADRAAAGWCASAARSPSRAAASAQLMPVFMRRYPAVRIDMRVMNRPVDLIEEGIDLALRVRLGHRGQHHAGGKHASATAAACWWPARRCCALRAGGNAGRPRQAADGGHVGQRRKGAATGAWRAPTEALPCTPTPRITWRTTSRRCKFGDAGRHRREHAA